MSLVARIELVPHGFPCRLADCPHGPFLYGDTVGMVSVHDGVYVVDDGDAFWGSTTTGDSRNDLIVQPLDVKVITCR